MNWLWKCNDCKEISKEEDLERRINPSGIEQEACPKCGGAVIALKVEDKGT